MLAKIEALLTEKIVRELIVGEKEQNGVICMYLQVNSVL